MLIESVFEYQKPIPTKYTCEGENVSPPLKFKNIPQGTKSLALIVDDPDAPNGTFDHWIVWNISPNVYAISEGGHELFGNHSTVKQGTNHYNVHQYKGPCPPPGKPHRYFFKLYALDKMLTLKEGAKKEEVEQAMEGHVVDRAELIGTYKR